MMKVLLAVLFLAPAVVAAQPAGAPDGGVAPSIAQPPRAAPGNEISDEMNREIQARVEAAKRQIREELRAELAAQNQGTPQDQWPEEKRKLEFFVPNGYLRTRPDLFYKFDLGRGVDTLGYTLFPRSLVSQAERTTAGINMRFRFEPTINVSEEVRIKAQIDALDNILFGSTPDYAGSRSDGQVFSIFSNSQAAPQAGINAIANSINVKRVYAEITTPVGILRFGRMGFHWGLGMVHNDGNCLDCDHGDTVDRVMFVAQPAQDLYVSPMIDWNGIGPSSARIGEVGEPFPFTNSDQTLSFSIAIAKRDTEQQAKAKLLNNQTVLNYGIHLMYRTQKNDPARFIQNSPFTQADLIGNPYAQNMVSNLYIPRRGSYYLPDIWAKFERKRFRIEIEAAALLGSFDHRQTTTAQDNFPTTASSDSLKLTQFGAVGQGEVRFFDGALHVGLEMGFASGDNSPGFGNHPGRVRAVNGSNAVYSIAPPGAFDGPKFCMSAINADGSPCTKGYIRSFRFNPDYRIDMILWREILGNVTGALYMKPSIAYDITEGFKVFAAVIYSRAAFVRETPSGTNPNLGIELNVGTRYETEDGFFAQLMWGVLFPLGGLGFPPNVQNAPGLDTAQALRGMLGVRF
jgi:uncharacterized protein (TIGR04551 family)